MFAERWKMERIWVLDTEGSGGSPNEPIQLAAVEMVGFEITGKAHLWNFRPKGEITPFATRVHGIRNSDAVRWPSFSDQEDEIRQILGGTAIAGHAVNVELDMVASGMADWSPARAFCTLRMARRIHPAQKRHKLTVLTAQYGLIDAVGRMTGRRPHDALYDATATALLLSRFHEDEGERFHRLLEASDVMASRRSQHEAAARKARQAELKRIARESRA